MTGRCLSWILIALLCVPLSSPAQIYKYQDEQGRWHFSDQKPKQKAEQVKLKPPGTSSPKRPTDNFSLERESRSDSVGFYVTNPFPAPLQCFVREISSGDRFTQILEPNERKEVFSSTNLVIKDQDLEYFCVVGDPRAVPDKQVLSVPFTGFKSMRVSQGFGGRFSHSTEPQVNALDIALPVGTQIVAARAGIVIATEDKYAYAGFNSSFFYDKANHVVILHDDGSYATYAHLLIGKIEVEVGDRVETGDVIGYSGNTGFSTGPHLHFVVQHNNNGEIRSLPFTLIQSDGTQIKPERGAWLLPAE